MTPPTTIPWDSLVHLDRMQLLTGTLSGADTVWALTFTDDTIDTIVLGPDFGVNYGKVVEIDSNSGGTVTVGGVNYTAGEVAIGRAYTMSIELTRPYFRDRNGTADFDAGLQLMQVQTGHNQTGAYTLRAVQAGRSDRTVSLDLATVEKRGSLRGWFQGEVDDISLFIESSSPKPVTVTSVEYAVQYSPRMAMAIDR